ncbi:hypothetical protein ASZ90_016967 [hydrocarbon metagenome]|uniref:Uncharacterized protein n=1 Tax=hydrocarbon metagenome TaxID=938273 RepID=A0A0W8EAP4_9ZZZZ
MRPPGHLHLWSTTPATRVHPLEESAELLLMPEISRTG